MNMKRIAIMVAAVVLVASLAGGASAFTITCNGDLSDWGVLPFGTHLDSSSGWIPTLDEGIAYNETDNNVLRVNDQAAVLQDEMFDFEALYAQVTPDRLSLAMVTSYNWQNTTYTDLMDNYSGAPVVGTTWQGQNHAVDRALTISLAFPALVTAGKPSGWNYGVRLWNDQAMLYSVGAGRWEGAQWFTENNPVGFTGDSGLLATSTHASGDYTKLQPVGWDWTGDGGFHTSAEPAPRLKNSSYADTWIYEVSFDLRGTALGGSLTPGEQFWAHSSPWCGNDSLTIANEGTVSYTPEPTSLVLLALMVGGTGWRLRRRRPAA